MAGLEARVRGVLIDQRANELIRYVRENPEHIAIITELVETITESIANPTISAFGYVDEKERAEMVQNYREEILPLIRNQFDNPEQLKRIMYKEARNQYMTVEQLKAELKGHIANLEEEEIDKDVVVKYENLYDGLFKFVKTNDRIVKKLAKVAKTEGIGKATQKETIYAVIREIFPTSEKYRTFAQRGIETVRNFYKQSQTVLMAGGEIEKALGGMFGTLERAQERILNFQGPWLEKIITEIYG